MSNIRVIPRLDIKGPNLVKGIHLEGLRVLGKPEQFARYYYENGADELIYTDIVASLYNRNSLKDIISRTAREIFIPFAVGGGLRTIDDIREVLRAGADKVSLNTAAVKDSDLIRKASRQFGSSTIIIAIEAIKQRDGRYFAYTDNGRNFTGVEVVEWARRVEELGAGEILLTSVDREGTGQGFDIALVKMITDAVTIPVIAHGGAGKLQHIADAIETGGATSVAVASMLHYHFIRQQQSASGFEEGNLDFLRKGGSFGKVTPVMLQDIKQFLREKNIETRSVKERNEIRWNANSRQ